ncbi:MAG TPA: hypothetical protein VKB57_16635, partial [Acidimicrobiales bacterium]|nr:hypothetical protein [Acidimicrobiales bacterium]
VRHKLEVLHGHCAKAGRDPAEITVTHLGTADAPSVEDHVGRYRQYAEAGVDWAIVNFADPTDPGPVAAFGEVIEAFRRRD